MNEMSPEEAEDMGWNDRFDMEEEERIEGAAREMLAALKDALKYHMKDSFGIRLKAIIAKAEGK